MSYLLIWYLTSSMYLEERMRWKGVSTMNKDCEIGTLGKYTVMMSLADLKEIANGEVRAYSEELEHENSALQAKLDKAVEALKFYAEQEHYLDHCRDYSEYDNADWIEGNVENGQKAREALEEIENDRQS